jgi:orotidine-5'-phosphate decarboxylase
MISPIILALDTSDISIARRWIECTRESIDIYKFGLEFYLSFGANAIAELSREFDISIFLDLKLHDIPNTVSGATGAIAPLAPKFLTVHASGGGAMISAAVAAAPSIDITAVTILTSLSEQDLQEVGFAQPPLESAVSLAQLAISAGARAIVCSPLEIAAIRAVAGSEIAIISPGVRPALSSGGDDQMRTMTPSAAREAGADYLVIGRPITSQWSNGAQAMSEAAKKIKEEL